MQLHQAQPKHHNKRKKRIGRGGKRGTYSGKGVKGQNSRAGRKMQPVMRELIKRYHKLRGYRQVSLLKAGIVLNIDKLEKSFSAGDKVSPAILLEKGLVAKIKGKMPPIKILGRGELSKKLDITGLAVSKTAKEKIKKAGGSVK